MKHRLFAALLLMAPAALPAAGTAATAPAVAQSVGAMPDQAERSLGLGLSYVRVRVLPADLPPRPMQPTPVVLDLRYVKSDPGSTAAVQAWLSFRATPHTPVFVLVNKDTAADLLGILDTAASIPGVVSIGPPSSRFVPDVLMKPALAEERAAYDALENGASIDSLVTDHPAKTRYDEATIAREYHSTAETDGGDFGVDEDDRDDDEPVKAPPPVVDRTLQRAVQLHRGLLALRKL